MSHKFLLVLLECTIFASVVVVDDVVVVVGDVDGIEELFLYPYRTTIPKISA